MENKNVEKLELVSMANFRYLREWDPKRYKSFIKDLIKAGLVKHLKLLELSLDTYKTDDPSTLNEEHMDALYEAYFNLKISEAGWTEEIKERAREYCFKVSNIDTFEADLTAAVVDERADEKMEVTGEKVGDPKQESFIQEEPVEEPEKSVEKKDAKVEKPAKKESANKTETPFAGIGFTHKKIKYTSKSKFVREYYEENCKSAADDSRVRIEIKQVLDNIEDHKNSNHGIMISKICKKIRIEKGWQ